MEIDLINDTETPITEKTFIRQGWEKVFISAEESGEDEEYTYWTLPLPKDNPDKYAKCLISSTDDSYQDVGLKKGEYSVELFDFAGLGICFCEEDLELLYLVLSRVDIEPKK